MKIVPIKLLNVAGAKIPVAGKPGDAGRDAWVTAFKLPVVVSGEKKLLAISELPKNHIPIGFSLLGDSEYLSPGHTFESNDSYTLHPLDRVGCCLGFATAIPEGYYFQVVPRSGHALWDGLIIVNTPGTIDEGFRNEWMAIVANISAKDATIRVGDRICQVILARREDYQFLAVPELPDSPRGLGGYGSTGVR